MADRQQAPEHDRPLVNIVGELVALGPLRRDLLPLYLRWINDFGTTRTLGIPSGPMTWEQEEAWFNRAAAAEHTIHFTIYERSIWRPVGTCGLNGVDYRNRGAEIGILIGEADARGKGYGTETIRLMLDYGFTALGLNNLMLRVFEYNLAAQRAYQKAGMREFGRRREAQFMDGRLWDVIYMDCLAGEFASPVLGRVFVPDQPRG